MKGQILLPIYLEMQRIDTTRFLFICEEGQSDWIWILLHSNFRFVKKKYGTFSGDQVADLCTRDFTLYLARIGCKLEVHWDPSKHTVIMSLALFDIPILN